MNIFFQAGLSEFCDLSQLWAERKVLWSKFSGREKTEFSIMSAETYSWDSRIAFVVRYMYGELSGAVNEHNGEGIRPIVASRNYFYWRVHSREGKSFRWEEKPPFVYNFECLLSLHCRKISSFPFELLFSAVRTYSLRVIETLLASKLIVMLSAWIIRRSNFETFLLSRRLPQMAFLSALSTPLIILSTLRYR